MGALALLERCESSSLESEQLLYDILFMLSRHDFANQTAEKRAQFKARIKELTANPGIRSDPFAIINMETFPRWKLLLGYDPRAYDPPNTGANPETLTQASVL